MRTFTADDVCIGMPTFNDPDLMVRALLAVIDTVPEGVPVAIADDCSEQGNAKVAARTFGGRVHVIANDHWHGSPWVRNQLYAWADTTMFGRVNNGTSRPSVEIVKGKPLACLIDMDVIVRAGWLEALLDVMNAQPWCWLATFPKASFEPRDRWLDEGSRFRRCEEVGWLCAFTRLRALHECPGWESPTHGTFGMDERLRGASHDSELCQRVNHDSSWRVYLADENLIEHQGYHSGKGVRAAFVRESREESRGTWGFIMGERNWWGTLPSSTPPPADPPTEE